MKNVLNILRILILSGILATTAVQNCTFAQESKNSLIQDVLSIDSGFDNLVKNHPELGLTEADRDWY